MFCVKPNEDHYYNTTRSLPSNEQKDNGVVNNKDDGLMSYIGYKD